MTDASGYVVVQHAPKRVAKDDATLSEVFKAFVAKEFQNNSWAEKTRAKIASHYPNHIRADYNNFLIEQITFRNKTISDSNGDNLKVGLRILAFGAFRFLAFWFSCVRQFFTIIHTVATLLIKNIPT